MRMKSNRARTLRGMAVAALPTAAGTSAAQTADGSVDQRLANQEQRLAAACGTAPSGPPRRAGTSTGRPTTIRITNR